MAQDIYRFQVGAIHCMVIADIIEPLAEDRIQRIFGSNAERMLAAFRALPDPQQNCYNILYLETGGKRVLVDTGIGHLNPDRPGRLIALLRAEGIEPEMIDTVIVTHFHPDHIGGMIDQDGKPTFPKARVVTRDIEYHYWMDEALLSTLDPNRAEVIRRVFAVYTPDLARADNEVEPGICLVAAPGHTPGQSALLIESQGSRLLHTADTFHMVMQLNAPECIPSFDSLPDVGITTRRAIFERAEREVLLVMAYHLSFPGLGHIKRNASGLSWIPDASL
jgi:glyoxylase-like metal-dependent hydrolase (beta-lactamase superfamily II)